MKFLTETFIAEAVKDAKKGWCIEGIFMQSNIKNRNGRVYPKSTLDEETNRYIKEYVEQGRAIGELNHPSSPSINLDRVSHKITGLVEDGNNWVGQAQILNTPMGEVVKGLLEGGVKIGVSSRGLGSLKEKNGLQEVQNDFKLAAIDIVSDPSAPDAFVTGLNEDVDWIFCENGQCYIKSELVEKQAEFVKKNYATLTEEQKFNMFEAFIKNLK